MAAKETQKVFTYSVSGNKLSPEYEEMQKALTEGYKVVDIISTPSGPAGGGANAFGSVVVTVLLVPGGFAGIPYTGLRGGK